MSSNNESQKTPEDGAPADAQSGKKPYEAPAWEVEDAEAEAAMGCAKADVGTCAAGPITS